MSSRCANKNIPWHEDSAVRDGNLKTLSPIETALGDLSMGLTHSH